MSSTCQNNQSRNYCHSSNEHSFFQDATESFEEAVSIIRKGVNEYKCLRKAFCLYLLSVQINIISSTCFNFLRYYPTFVGWIFLATKVKRFIEKYKSPKGDAWKPSHDNGSTHTCDTVSSTMSQDTIYFADLSGEQEVLSNDVAHFEHVNQQPTESCSWGYFADVSQSAIHEPDGIEGTISQEDRHTRSSSDKEVDLRKNTYQLVQDEWGYFADFQDEEPRPDLPVDTEKKRESVLVRAKDYYDICVRFMQMHYRQSDEYS